MSQRMHWVLGAGWVGGTTNPVLSDFQKYFQQKQFLTQRPLEKRVLLPVFKNLLTPIFFCVSVKVRRKEATKEVGDTSDRVVGSGSRRGALTPY